MTGAPAGSPSSASPNPSPPRPVARRVTPAPSAAPTAPPTPARPERPARPAPAQPEFRRAAAAPAEPRPTRSPSILSQLEARPALNWPNLPVGAGERAPEPSIPGAYLAPSAAYSAPLLRPRPGDQNESRGLLRSAAPQHAASATAAALPVAFARPEGGPPPVTDSSPTARRWTVAPSAPAELAGWLAIAGSAVAAVSFLMPWSRDGVIGAVGSAYFDRWGLANSGYLPLVLFALGLLALNGIPNPIPAWIRAGLAPLTIGGILFGLDWAYQTRPYSDGLGVTLLLVAALVLMAGGIVGVRAGRHPAAPPLV